MQMQRIGGLEGIRQDEKGFVTVPERGVMPKASWMYHVYTGYHTEFCVTPHSRNARKLDLDWL